MRITVLVFSAGVCAHAIALQCTPIHEQVSGACQVTLVGAFVPLAAGLYWKRATTQGAVFSIALGVAAWLLFLCTPACDNFPPQLAGLMMAGAGMVIGSLGPQAIRNAQGSHHRPAGMHGTAKAAGWAGAYATEGLGKRPSTYN